MEDYGVAHHGAPILVQRDIDYCMALVTWIRTAQASDRIGYGPNWLPSEVDIIKSRLFWRLRSGKDPLPEPPPCCYSCPWYEVVEELTPHWTHECWSQDGRAYIGQTGYEIEKSAENGIPEIVTFGGWRFRVSAGKHPRNPMVDGFYIQRIAENEVDGTAQETVTTE